jgi:hypothetical protein
MPDRTFTSVNQQVSSVMTFSISCGLEGTWFEFLLAMMTILKITGGVVRIELSRKQH